MAIIDRRGASVSSADPPAATTPNPDLAIKTAVRVATVGAIALTGLQTIDGIALAAGDRVLVKDQADQTTNGIYAASSGNWQRTVDAANNSQWANGCQVLVNFGTANRQTVFVLSATDPIVLDASALAFAQEQQEQGGARTAVDVYLIGGQSNGVGQGTAASSPTVPTGKVLQVNGSTITDANDPVGSANTGSAWPTFGLTYFNATGRRVAFVPAAVDGTAQTAAADTGAGNWDASGTMYSLSVAALNAALTALDAAGYDATLKGILWCQGEQDGGGINSSLITEAAYKGALAAMIARYRAAYGAQLPFYIFRTGTFVGQSDVGYFEVRDAQEQVAAADPYTFIVFRNAIDFPVRNLIQVDNEHYTQAGYNEMGQVGASAVVSGRAGTYLVNPFQASAGVQQWSPRLHWVGQGWATGGGGSSQTIEWIAENQTVQGSTNPSGKWTLSVSVAGGAFNPALIVTTAGVVQAGTSFLAQDAVGVTSADGLVLQNLTAAANGLQQWSPRVRLSGQGWKTNATAASQQVDWIIENQTVQGTSAPTANLEVSVQVNGAGYNPALIVSSAGVVQAGTGFLVGAATAGRVLRADGSKFISAQLAFSDLSGITYPASATSGGVAYFSSTTAMASSGLMTANGVMYGGGAGNPPLSTAQGGANTILTANSGAPAFSAAPIIGTSLSVGSSNNVSHTTVLIGANTTGVAGNLSGVDATLQLVAADAASTNIAMNAFGNFPQLLGLAAGGTAASPTGIAATNVLFAFGAYGYDSGGGAYRAGAAIQFVSTDTFTSAHNGTIIKFLSSPVSGTVALAMSLQSGLQIGSAPTGGDKGAGTINVSSGIFLNNSAYTNPDYAFEHFFTGAIARFADKPGAARYGGLMPLDALEPYLREHLRLPGLTDDPADIFGRADTALEKIEETTLYVLELHRRVAALEARAH